MPYSETKPEPKVFNKTKNLFCYVAHYCNLVAEFNGLVSKKGPVFLPAFFILSKIEFIFFNYIMQVSL
jgi:hypothetical protein